MILVKECIIYPNDGTSKVHSYFGLPEIADNIMEGVVIKPVTPAFFFNRERIIIKNKNDIFKERARKKESVNPNKENRLDFEMSEDGKLMCVEVLTYVTENRLRNVLSKVQGGITHKMFGPLLGMFSKDVLADFMKDNAEEYSKLEDRERKRVTKAMSEVASTMLRENFVNIIDNNF